MVALRVDFPTPPLPTTTTTELWGLKPVTAVMSTRTHRERSYTRPAVGAEQHGATRSGTVRHVTQRPTTEQASWGEPLPKLLRAQIEHECGGSHDRPPGATAPVGA